jgi:phage repressor protein C with HTH and peptisase S24 domain
MKGSEKINMILEYLSLNPSDFAKAVGLRHAQNVYDIQKNKVDISKQVATKIVAAFPNVDKHWLLTGEGEMFKNEDEKAYSVSTEKNASGSYRLVPLYNLDAVGGMNTLNEVLGEPEYIERYVPFEGAGEHDVCMYVSGNSMMPTYNSGCILLTRRVEGWREYFGYGHCYVLFLKDGRRILKEVQKSEINPNEYVLCVSYNEKNPPEELSRNFILAVYKVVMSLTTEGF